MTETSTAEWQQLAVEIASGIKEWLNQHPQATLAEIEREMMQRMAQLQARLMEDILRAKAKSHRCPARPECHR